MASGELTEAMLSTFQAVVMIDASLALQVRGLVDSYRELCFVLTSYLPLTSFAQGMLCKRP